MFDFTEPSHSGRSAGPGRRWPAAPAPRSGRRAWCRCRAPRPRPRRTGRGPASASACADHPLLRRAVRRGQAVGGAVLVDRGAAHHGEHRGARCGARRTAAPAAARRRPRPSRCRRRRRRTTCTGRPAASPRCRVNSTNVAGVAITVDAAGQRQRALARAQRLARQVQRDQRRRAGGVDGDRRALAGRTCRRPGRRRRCRRCRSAEVALELVGRRRQPDAVVVVHRRRRTRRSGCRAATPGRCRRARTPPRTSPAAAAAAGPSPAPRAGDAEERRRRTRPASCRNPPLPGVGRARVRRGRGRRARRGPSRGRPGTRRSRRRPSATSCHRSSGEPTPPG